MKKTITYFLLSLFLIHGLQAQKFFLETKNTKGQITMSDDRMPTKYKLFRLNKQQLKTFLGQAPDLRSGNISSVILEIPLPNRKTERFNMYQTHPMSPRLEAKFPEILSFRGVNKNGQRLRLDINGSGVFYSIYGLKEGRAVFQIFDSLQTYMLYYIKNQQKPDEHVCLIPDVSDDKILQDNLSRQASSLSDGLHRTYKLAYAATGEFSQFHIQRAITNGSLSSNATDAQKKEAVLDALTVIVNRINEVYEVDLAITLQLVSDNDDIIYLDGATDPYTNNDGYALIPENQTNIDNVIGSADYDIGHVANTGTGGLASVGVVCTNGSKAKGESGSNQPIGDEYAIDLVAHEMGHQFGATHTFSNHCGGRRHNQSAVEPGSGSSIMAYPGTCAPNVQQDSDQEFHYWSINEIWNYIQTTSCAQTTSANNNAPQVDAGADKWIPKYTPFKLEASGTDNDAGTTLSYSWDETDVFVDPNPNGTNSFPQSTNTTGPMFRKIHSHKNNFRYFPQLRNILVGSIGNIWEVLPTVQRTLSFQVLVRDLTAPGGQVASDDIVLNVDGNAGPFRVTSHQTNVDWTPGDTETITWDVAGTNTGNVNCQFVDILLSLDDGNSYPIVLADNTPNDGSQDIIVPDEISPNARYMVKASDNYFYHINQGIITLGDFTTDCSYNYTTSPNLPIPDDDSHGVTSTLTVTDDIDVMDLNLSLNISHTYIRDLKIKLASPQGTEILVFDQNCGSGTYQNIDVTFDDEASYMSCSGLSEGNTYQQPVNLLSVFNGENAQGTWTLTVSDNANGDTGTLNSWGLNFCIFTKSNPVRYNENTIKNLTVYPNPASKNINISFDPQTTGQVIIVTDMLSREIYSVELNETSEFTHSINVEKWPKGIYLFNIKDGEKHHIEKIIIK